MTYVVIMRIDSYAPSTEPREDIILHTTTDERVAWAVYDALDQMLINMGFEEGMHDHWSDNFLREDGSQRGVHINVRKVV